MIEPLKHLKSIKEGTSAKFLERISPGHWEISTVRQELFSPHRETKNLYLRSIPDTEFKPYSDVFFEQGLLINHPPLNEFLEPMNLVLDEIKELIEIKDWAASLILLPAGKQVYKHRDTYPCPSNLHRIHLPVMTNDHCFFSCGKIRTNMKIDNLYEVRNLNFKHKVNNQGDTDRIHLVVDVIGDYRCID
jgi:hypothetical protein